MGAPLVALGVDNTPINALGSFSEGRQAAAQDENNTLKNAQATIEMIGSGAAYALPNGPDGEVDPAKYNEVLDGLGSMGLNVDKFRGNPNFAKVALQASITATQRLQQANNERDYQHTIEEFKHTLDQDALSNQRADRALDITQQNSDSLAASRTGTGGTGIEGDIPTQIAGAIMRGEQVDTTGLYKYGPGVRAILAKNGFDMAQQKLDYEATKKRLGSLNSTQQVRLEQATAMVEESLPLVEDLADQWNAGGFPSLNSAQLRLALEGALGPEANSIATRLKAQIDDVASELGTVYKGGNSSTDESLKLAKSQLDAEWSEATLRDAIAQIKMNIRYRKNSIAQSRQTVGTTGDAFDAGGGNDNDPMGLRGK